MKKTEQYGLNQWELPDPILMSDFNADNAKIAAELARLRQNVFGLAYYIGQFGLVHNLNGQLYAGQHIVLSETFHEPEYFNCSGGVVIANDRATLTGKGAVGSVTTERGFLGSFPSKTAVLWLHYKGGTVIPYLNGVPLEHTDTRIYDSSPIGGMSLCEEFTLDVPFVQHPTLKLEMNCGNDSSMELFDICLAQL